MASATDIAKRREKIEAFMLAEMGPSQIMAAWAEDPSNGKLQMRTLERDMAEIRREWEANADALIQNREAARLQLLKKAKRAEQKAWDAERAATTPSEKTGAIRTALKAQQRQAQLLGLDVHRVEGQVNLGGKVEVTSDTSNLTDAQLLERADTLRKTIAITAASVGGSGPRARGNRAGA